jgi:taurine dioxygenase
MRLHPTRCFDNRASSYAHISVRPLSAAMGAEIVGVNLNRLTEAEFAEMRDALFRHRMIFLRNQEGVGHAEHAAFSLRFGAFAEDAYTNGIEGFPAVQPLIKEADDQSDMVFGEGWHSDSPFLPQPPAITILRSVEIPPFGGDTTFANTGLAYRTLSEGYRRLIAPLRMHFSLRDVLASAQAAVQPSSSPIGKLAATRSAAELPEDLQRKISGAFHPLVRTHPVTEERTLYTDPSYGIGIEGLLPEESAPILKFLHEHLLQPVFSCRLRWEPSMIALWDNRLCVHQAYNDYSGHRREMYRTTVAGEVPR